MAQTGCSRRSAKKTETGIFFQFIPTVATVFHALNDDEVDDKWIWDA